MNEEASSDLSADSDSLQRLTTELRQFSADREWDQFHSPRNLAAALAVEAAEVLEHFQWSTSDESTSLPPDKRSVVAMELADVLLYLVRLADRLDIDLLDAARRKLAVNAERYPVHLARGSSKKYTEL